MEQKEEHIKKLYKELLQKYREALKSQPYNKITDIQTIKMTYKETLKILNKINTGVISPTKATLLSKISFTNYETDKQILNDICKIDNKSIWVRKQGNYYDSTILYGFVRKFADNVYVIEGPKYGIYSKKTITKKELENDYESLSTYLSRATYCEYLIEMRSFDRVLYYDNFICVMLSKEGYMYLDYTSTLNIHKITSKDKIGKLFYNLRFKKINQRKYNNLDFTINSIFNSLSLEKENTRRENFTRKIK